MAIFHSYFDITRGYNHRNPMESPSITMKFPMKIPPCPYVLNRLTVFFGASSGSPPRSQGNLGNFVEKIQGFLRCAQMDEKQRRPCWRTRSGWGGSRYVCQVKRYEKVRCNVVKPCKPNHRPPNFGGFIDRLRKNMIWWWPVIWRESRNYICKSCCVSHVFYKPLKFKSFFGGKTCWSCFVWEIVHHFREFFRKLLCSQCFCYEESSDKNWRSGDESLRGSKS